MLARLFHRLVDGCQGRSFPALKLNLDAEGAGVAGAFEHGQQFPEIYVALAQGGEIPLSSVADFVFEMTMGNERQRVGQVDLYRDAAEELAIRRVVVDPHRRVMDLFDEIACRSTRAGECAVDLDTDDDLAGSGFIRQRLD